MRTRVIPLLLLHQGGLVKSVRFKNYRYIGDPINAVKIFNEKEVDEIVILNIDATQQKKPPNFELIKEIASEAFMPMAYGGGITTLNEVKQILYNGMEKVVINKAATTNPQLITDIAQQFGSQSVVVSIDYKRNLFGKQKIMTNNGKQNISPTIIEFAKQMEAAGAGELMLTNIDNEGTYNGYDLQTLQQIAAAVSIPIVVAGGASTVTDFALAVQHGASAVAAGSMFVLQRPHQAVLISYPTQQELKEKLFTIDN